jgi:dGTPase
VDDDLTRCDFHFAATTYRNAKKLAENARYRTAFTSELVKTLMAGVSIVPREPACLSKVAWDRVALERVMVLKHFTFFVIRTPALQAFETNGRHVVSELCRLLWADPEGNKLPPDCRARFTKKMVKVSAAKAELAALLDAGNVRSDDGDGDAVLQKRREELQKRVRRWEARAKRDICDFVAGMTDNYAVEFYGRLTSLTPTTIHKKP